MIQSTPAPGITVRLQAARVLLAVTKDYKQLDDALSLHNEGLSAKDTALLQAVCYGVMRWHEELIFWLEHLAKRPAKEVKPAVRMLILSGLFQLKYMRVPPHAAIHATVECAAHLKAGRAKGLINAVLRSFQRILSDKENDKSEQILKQQSEAVILAHPQWMLDKFKIDWPADWQQIAQNNNLQAPMTIRVNTRQLGLDEYLSRLRAIDIEASKHPVAKDALVLLRPCDVEQIPGFSDGLVSVQDAAAQLAAPLLQYGESHRVLDACAAPGGKTAHILQLGQSETVIALDNSQFRLKKVEAMLKRLGEHAEIVQGDAKNPDTWWDGKLFDQILLDAPCSASGVIRRHPDIKYLRSERALQKIVKRQAKILAAMWQLLKPGGMLLYVTCSVFKIENEDQIEAFMAQHSDAALAKMPLTWGRGKIGRQVLPGDSDMDGFYFALLVKS